MKNSRSTLNLLLRFGRQSHHHRHNNHIGVYPKPHGFSHGPSASPFLLSPHRCGASSAFSRMNGSPGDLSTVAPTSVGVAAASAAGNLAVHHGLEHALEAKDGLLAFRHYGRCYWDLSKARLSMLVATTTGAGFALGSGSLIDYAGLSWTCMGTMLIACSANTINQIMEVRFDSQMKRTMGRPLPSGRITTHHAAMWALFASVVGTTVLASKVNLLATGLGVANLLLYTAVYTPLKQIHPINTWVGAVVGAIPPLLGWAAASGNLGPGAWALAGALYLWQIPHFMAIAYLCKQDYAIAGYKMLSMLDVSGKRTAGAALRNSAYLLPLGFVASYYGLTSEWFTLEATTLTLGMLWMSVLFHRKPSTETARKLFRSSLLYLPLFMAGMLIHRIPREDSEEVMEEDSTIKSREDGAFTVMEVISFDDNRESLPRRKARPPVAHLSVAPFPFLPAPEYY